MNSALYAGMVRHRRSGPVAHAFRYRMFMLYLDLEELPALLRAGPLFSDRKLAPLRFQRADYLSPETPDLAVAVRDRVEEELGRRPLGPIRMLTHVRTFGYVMNPVTFYYCFDRDGRSLDAIVAEITNTPWNERFAYVIDAARHGAAHAPHGFDKRFHVSPFMPMDQRYEWRFGLPGRRLSVHMENHTQEGRVFDATLVLQRREFTTGQLYLALLGYPFLTARVIAGIYWQAARLRLKGAPVHTHPSKVPA